MTDYCNPNTEAIEYADDTLIFAAKKPFNFRRSHRNTNWTSVLLFRDGKFATEYNEIKIRNNKQTYQDRNLKRTKEVGKERIHTSKHMKHLGITMDCDMLLQPKIETALRDMATSTQTLHQIRKSLLSTTLVLLYKTLNLSQFE